MQPSSFPLRVGVGTDIVHIPRIAQTLERFGDRFLDRVFTTQEQNNCKRHSAKLFSKPEHRYFAGRWAAKEAVAKALGTGWKGIGYTDIEITRQDSGMPSVCLSGRAATLISPLFPQWQLSISHDGDYAIATALLFCFETQNPTS